MRSVRINKELYAAVLDISCLPAGQFITRSVNRYLKGGFASVVKVAKKEFTTLGRTTEALKLNVPKMKSDEINIAVMCGVVYARQKTKEFTPSEECLANMRHMEECQKNLIRYQDKYFGGN